MIIPEEWKKPNYEDKLQPNDKIPYCLKEYTLAESKKKCPLGGCWKFRCFDSLLHGEWSAKREVWHELHYGKHREVLK